MARRRRVPEVKLLLDTHILLWWLGGSPELPPEHRVLLEAPRNEILVSSISVAEIAIKASLGKLGLPDEPMGIVLAEEGFDELEFRSDHADRLRDLPLLHRDPFDRMLVAQALVEDAVLVTADRAVRQYAVQTV